MQDLRFHTQNYLILWSRVHFCQYKFLNAELTCGAEISCCIMLHAHQISVYKNHETFLLSSRGWWLYIVLPTLRSLIVLLLLNSPLQVYLMPTGGIHHFIRTYYKVCARRDKEYIIRVYRSINMWYLRSCSTTRILKDIQD